RRDPAGHVGDRCRLLVEQALVDLWLLGDVRRHAHAAFAHGILSTQPICARFTHASIILCAVSHSSAHESKVEFITTRANAHGCRGGRNTAPRGATLRRAGWAR